MIDSFQDHLLFPTAIARARRNGWLTNLWLFALFGLTTLLALYFLLFGPNPAVIAWLLYCAGAALIVYQPRYGVYLIVFLALVGDGFLSIWYPFNKNFSSRESLMYLSDSLIISPMECYLVLTLAVWWIRGALQRNFRMISSWATNSAFVFLFFILFGLVYGIARGGSIVVALWESRPIFYLPLMLVLANNLFSNSKHINHLMWLIMLALFLEGLNGSIYYFVLVKGDLGNLDAMGEHSAAIHLNTYFVYMLAVWLYKASPFKRFFLPLMLLPVLIMYLAAQRRAAFLTIAIALFLMAIILFKENRKLFLLIVPPLAVVAILYLGAFWNQSGALALPAQAVKSVIAEDQASLEDQLSNLYRILENVNAHFNIRNSPLTGIGFGQKLIFIVPLPDISFFVWWEYIIHNSIIWIWIKTGIGGFISLLFLVGLSIITGLRALMQLPSSDLSAVTLTGVLYIIMHFIYAYVDMSWDNQSMIYMGTMMGVLSVIFRIAPTYKAQSEQQNRLSSHRKPSPFTYFAIEENDR